MANENAKIDNNEKPVAMAITDDANQYRKMLRIDDTTKGLKVMLVGGTGAGTVTSVSVSTANGVSGSVATATSTPAITLALGAITPTSVNGLTLASQAVGFTIAGGTTSKTLTVPLDASVSGTNTGDQNLSGYAPLTAPTFQTSINGAYLTASQILITDVSSNIVSAPVATYPSLTELSYVKGLTSAVQSQLNGKQATLTNPVTGTGNANEIAYFTGASVISSLAVATYPSLTELSYVKGVTSGIQSQINAKGTGTVTSVTSANADIGVATTTTTPVLTLNSGTSANQIVKLDGSAKLPAVDGSALTNLPKTIANSFSIAVRTSQLSYNTSAAETNIIANTSLAGGSLSAGRAIKFECHFSFNQVNSTSFTIKIYYGGTSTSFPLSRSNNGSAALNGTLVATIAYVGASSQYIGGTIMGFVPSSATASNFQNATVTATSAIDQSSAQNVRMTVTTSGGEATENVIINSATIHLI